MRRRDVLAGLGSVAVLGGAGLVATGAVPSPGSDAPTGEDGNTEDGESRPETFSVETLEAPGSQAGEVTIPAPDRPTFIDFFGTWCPPCEEQMPALAQANEQVGDSVLFVSITTENVGGSVSKDTVVEWWEENDGDWLVGIDPQTELAAHYNVRGYPFAVAVDTAGTVQWSGQGLKTADELVAGIEQAIDDD